MEATSTRHRVQLAEMEGINAQWNGLHTRLAPLGLTTDDEGAALLARIAEMQDLRATVESMGGLDAVRRLARDPRSLPVTAAPVSIPTKATRQLVANAQRQAPAVRTLTKGPTVAEFASMGFAEHARVYQQHGADVYRALRDAAARGEHLAYRDKHPAMRARLAIEAPATFAREHSTEMKLPLWERFAPTKGT